jgi:hypothetical protein
LLLADDIETRKRMGTRARVMLDANFTRQHEFARWQRLLATV